jgi:hypothetical protein
LSSSFFLWGGGLPIITFLDIGIFNSILRFKSKYKNKKEKRMIMAKIANAEREKISSIRIF